jgi:uncharacterized protein (DUF1697 family)
VTAFVALLRGVNVGGKTVLPMAELKALCEQAGFSKVRTYIASGNVIFETELSEAKAKAVLEAALKGARKSFEVFIRNAKDIAEVARANPFPDAPGNRTVALFLEDPPPADLIERTKGVQDEQMRLGKRELYIFYPSGQARSKLAPPIKSGTARNLNTVTKLAQLAAEL